MAGICTLCQASELKEPVGVDRNKLQEKKRNKLDMLHANNLKKECKILQKCSKRPAKIRIFSQ